MDDPKLIPNANWQTKQRGSNRSEYELYRDIADDGKGRDITTGAPLKTYEQWLAS